MNNSEIEDFNTNLGLLADLFGIEYQSTPDMKVGMLKAMGVLAKDFDYKTQNEQLFMENLLTVKELVRQKKDANFRQIVHHVPVLRQNRVDTIEVSLPDGVTELKWSFLEDENPKKHYKGEVLFEDSEKVYSGEVLVNDLEPGSREKGKPSEHIIGDKIYRKYQFKFPFDVKLGYHQVEFSYIDKNGVVVACRSHIISAPEKCYDGIGVRDGNKTWGVPVQLYEQVSANNLGIGNYSDLAQIGYITGKNGAGLLGVNPVHANRSDQPENASPYSPDSRMFFNYVYLDVTAIEEFKRSPEINAYYNSSEFQDKVERNRRRSYVDYTVSQELVDDILYRCYKEFKKYNNFDRRYDDERFNTLTSEELDAIREEYNKYSVYCDEQDGILDKYATFRALSNYFSKKDPTPLDWTYWPDEYKDPNSKTVQVFMETHKDEIEFYKYAQWQCTKQLNEVKDVCLNSGMKIGLYMDMAVGASPKGFEAWYYKDLFIQGSAGATPDELSPTGQVWNVLGFNPVKLQEEGYEPYRRILEANMKYAGCMRIDHVLQLNRLYFHPFNGHNGTFVYYNSEELMALVALESHRHKTMIIGEDLGATTNEFRQQMEDYGILSYKVLPFERGYNNGEMRRPENYQQLSVCATSTHDTPTLLNQWNVQDIWQKKALGFYNEEILNNMFEQYATQRITMNQRLSEYGCWDKVGGVPSCNPREEANDVPKGYLTASIDYLARSRSAIMMVPLSDIFGVSEMGNIPGTLDVDMTLSSKKSLMEINGNDRRFYPNWRKKLHIPIEHFEDTDEFNNSVEILNEHRADGNDGKGKYYQFQRLGKNDPSEIDFEKAKKIHQLLIKREEYRRDAIIRNRYQQRAVVRNQNRIDNVQERMQKAMLAWIQRNDPDR